MWDGVPKLENQEKTMLQTLETAPHNTWRMVWVMLKRNCGEVVFIWEVEIGAFPSFFIRKEEQDGQE